jgi:hypothetical protein
MKKLAIGCGLVLVLTGIAAAGVAYYVYRQVSTTIAQFSGFAALPEIDERVQNKRPYTPPASEEITEAQVEKLAQVQSAIRQRVGERITEFEAKYKALLAQKDATLVDVPAVISAYGDLAATWMDAKRTQVEALNATGLSLEEYRWIRDQAYRALGQAFVDLDISRFIEDAKQGMTSENIGKLRGALEPGGPVINRERIERFKKILEENLALASFGL